MAFSPQTAKPLRELAEALLRGENTLTPAERELIATHVSYRNNCHFCHNSHGATAAYYLEGDTHVVDAVRQDPRSAPVSEKLRALLELAGAVQRGGKEATSELVEHAREHGATDREIHDTVLIAAAFCMYNRYVDGLATWAPESSEAYREAGAQSAEKGYMRTSDELSVTGPQG